MHSTNPSDARALLVAQINRLRDNLTELSMALKDHMFETSTLSQSVAASEASDTIAKFTLNAHKKPAQAVHVSNAARTMQAASTPK